MQVLLLDSYDAARVERLRGLIDPSWSIATSSHGAPEDELHALLANAEAVVTQYWGERTPPAPVLSLIQLPGAGFDAIDFACVPAHSAVCNVFEHEIGIAEYVTLALLESEIRATEMDHHLRAGRWQDGFVTGAPFHGELHGKRVGFLGFGHIARATALRMKPFGVEIWTRTRTPEQAGPLAGNAGGLEALDTMLEACHHIVVACPLTSETRGILDARRLALIGPEGVLVNVARGPIVDEAALFEALSSRTLGRAVIDTWYRYPDPTAGPGVERRPSRFPFHELDNVVMTSHASGWTDALFERRYRMIAENLERLRTGRELTHVLKPPGGSAPH